ncbi:hypothetical protein JCM10213v2_001299 [Rhodosporidiobolus nylandii]
MDSPQQEIRRVVRELCESPNANEILAAVDKYFAPDAQIIYPLFNSPKASGIEGVKAGYKMLRVLTYGQKVEFHAVGFDRIHVEKGIEKMKGFIDFTEHLKLSFFPVPDKLNPWFHFRFVSAVHLRGERRDWVLEQRLLADLAPRDPQSGSEPRSLARTLRYATLLLHRRTALI